MVIFSLNYINETGSKECQENCFEHFKTITLTLKSSFFKKTFNPFVKLNSSLRLFFCFPQATFSLKLLHNTSHSLTQM